MSNEGAQQRNLFPAYNADSKDHDSTPTRYQWLHNQSFNPTDDALEIQQSISKPDQVSLETEDDNCIGHSYKRKFNTSEDESSDNVKDDDKNKYASIRKKKKKEKKRKKRKKYKEKNKNEHEATAHSTNETGEQFISHVTGKVFIEDVHGLTPEHAYRIDRTPDPNNLTYGSIYSAHIARYNVIGNSVLGSKNKNLPCFGKRKHKRENTQSRYHWKGNIEKKTNSDTEDITIDMSGLYPQTKIGFSNQNICTDKYITLESEPETDDGKSTMEGSYHVYNPLSVYDTATTAYIQGKSADPEIAEKHHKVKTKETEFQKIQRQTGEYNKYLRDNSHDVAKWIEFINFQDTAMLIKEKESCNTEKKGKIKDVLIDIKLAVLNKALEKNPASLELKKIQLQIGAEIWDNSKLCKEWKELTFLHPNNPDVWWQYLLFLQSNLNIFSVSSVIKGYAKCLSTLDSIRSGTLKSHGYLNNAEEHMIHIFNMLAKFLKCTGHTEKAISMYQAAIEYNIFCPDILKQAGEKEKFDFLEAFWDSAIPRFGEDGALGWRNWVDVKGEVPFVSMYDKDLDDSAEKNLLSADSERSKTWTNMETSRMARHWLPWRPDVREGESEEDCEDPERIVMFDDIKPLIVKVNSAENKLQMILDLLGLIENECKIVSHSFPSKSVLAHRYQQVDFEGIADMNLENSMNLQQCCTSVQVNKETGTKFINNVFEQSVGEFQEALKTRLTLSWIQTKVDDALCSKNRLKKDKKVWKHKCKELKKWIKDILKEDGNRNNLLLWEAYANVESLLGNKDESANVLDKVLSMNISAGGVSSLPASTQYHIFKLSRAYTENQLEIRSCSRDEEGSNINKERALNILSSLPESESYKPLEKDSKVPSTKILKARRNYQKFVDDLSLQDSASAYPFGIGPGEARSTLVHAVVCFMYFQYITVDVHAASIVFQQYYSKMKSQFQIVEAKAGQAGVYFDQTDLFQKKVLEELTEAHISLLQYHIDKEVSPLSVLRIPLQQAIQEYPDNRNLLLVYANLESRGGIRGQLRRRLQSVAKHSSTPTIWISAVIAELSSIQRHKEHQSYLVKNYNKLFGGYNNEVILEPAAKHQLRSWFERAFEQPHNRRCILLWRLYMYSEAEYGDREIVRSIFYRAIQQCPGAKIIYLDFVHYFEDKLQEVIDLLVEKEVRLRTPLEELDLLLANREHIITNTSEDDEVHLRNITDPDSVTSVTNRVI